MFSFFGKEPFYTFFQAHVVPVNDPSSPSSPVTLDPHPSGTPMESVELTPPLAPGFEDTVSAPFGKEMQITIHRSAKDILQEWYNVVPPLVIFFLFTSRSYYKFDLGRPDVIDSAIKRLCETHYFLDLDQDKIHALEPDKILEKAFDKPH
ncbi:hypothetical protein DIZ76_012830 [Coccidioides immitis]|nr:hypothetical protein DIZ76_012830 [Coccidioides immitis]